MKIAKKILAVILAGIMLFAMFSVSVSAKEMTKSEVVKFYHSILKETAEKNEIVLTKGTWKMKASVDFSELSGLKLKLAQKMYDFIGYDGQWYEETTEEYMYGVDGEYGEATDSDIYFRFGFTEDIEYGYMVKEAEYRDNKITVLLEYSDEDYEETKKFTMILDKSHVIKKITEECFEKSKDYSFGDESPVSLEFEIIDEYTFVYNEVPAKSLTLSETDITLGYNETAEITYTVGPENASFKDVYVDVGVNDVFTPIWAYEEDGKIIIEALSEGSGIVEVCTYSGDVIATCQVNVEYSTWDRIVSIFDSIMSWFKFIFGIGF